MDKDRPGVGRVGEEVSIDELFDVGTVSSYLDKPRFVERSGLVERVEAALDDSAARFVLVTGPPGSGKSTLIAHLARQRPDAIRYFTRVDSITPLHGTDARTMLLSVGHQLSCLRPALFDPNQLSLVGELQAGRIAAGGRAAGIQIGDLHASPFYRATLRADVHADEVEGDLVGISVGEMTAEPRMLELSNLQYLALLDPAVALSRDDPGALIVVLLDALDEVRHGPRGEDILSWLTLCPQLPPNVRFVVTCRQDTPLLEAFRIAKGDAIREVVIGSDDAADVGTFLENFAAESAVSAALDSHKLDPGLFIDAAKERAGGNFQFAFALANAIDHALKNDPASKSTRELLTLHGIPGEVNDLYRHFLGRLRDEVTWTVRVPTAPTEEPVRELAWDAVFNPLLATLTVAVEPLSAEQLGAYAKVPADGFARGLEQLSQFLTRLPDDRIRFYHATLPEFLGGDATARGDDPLHVNVGMWNALIAGRLVRDNPDWAHCDDRYALAHTPVHLLRAVEHLPPTEAPTLRSKIDELLADVAYLERKTAMFTIEATLADFRTAYPSAQPGGAAAGLYRILRQEAHNLRRWRPDELPNFFAQQVYNAALDARAGSVAAQIAGRLAVSDHPYLVRKWQHGLGQEALTATLVHDFPVVAAAVSPNGERAVTVQSFDQMIRLWDLGTGEELGRERWMGLQAAASDSIITSIALSDDGETGVFAWGDQGQLGVFEFGSASSVRALDARHGRLVTAIAVTPGGIVTLCSQGTIGVWDRLTGSGKVSGELSSGRCLTAVSQDGRRAAVLDEAGAVTVWDVPGRTAVCVRAADEDPTSDCLGMSSDGHWVVVGDGDTLTIWDADTNQLVRRVAASLVGGALAVSSDGRFAVHGELGEVTVTDLTADEKEWVLGAHAAALGAVIAIGGGRRVLTCSDDHTVKVWDPDRPAQNGGGQDERVWLLTAAAVAPDAGLALSGAQFRPLMVWDLETGRALRVLGEHYMVTALAITPDGSRAMSSSEDGTVKIWDVEQGAELYCFGTPFDFEDGRFDRFISGAITPDGRFAAAASTAGFTNVWELTSGTCVAHLPNDHVQSAVALTPDGRRVLTGGEGGRIYIYDTETAGRRTYDGHVMALDEAATWARADALCVNSDGTFALSGGMDQLLQLWGTDTGQEMTTIPAYPKGNWTPSRGHSVIRALTFTNHDAFAAAAWDGRRVRVWDLRSQREIAAAGIPSYEFAALGGSTLGVLAGSSYHLAYYALVIPQGYEERAGRDIAVATISALLIEARAGNVGAGAMLAANLPQLCLAAGAPSLAQGIARLLEGERGDQVFAAVDGDAVSMLEGIVMNSVPDLEFLINTAISYQAPPALVQLTAQVALCISDESNPLYSELWAQLMRQIEKANPALVSAIILFRTGERGARLFQGLNPSGIWMIRKLLSSVTIPTTPDGLPTVWRGPVQGVVDAITQRAAGDPTLADDLIVYIEGALSAGDGPTTAVLAKFVAVLRGERGDSLLRGLSETESRVVRVLLDRLRTAGL
jgi:WD40 repeat protein